MAYDVSREKYPAWIYLPYITEPGFNQALRSAILEFDIGGIYTPNPVAWSYLNCVLKDIDPDIALVNEWPVTDELSGYRAEANYASRVLEQPLFLASSLQAKAAISPERKRVSGSGCVIISATAQASLPLLWGTGAELAVAGTVRRRLGGSWRRGVSHRGQRQRM